MSLGTILETEKSVYGGSGGKTKSLSEEMEEMNGCV